jgi:hypothetical protein
MDNAAGLHGSDVIYVDTNPEQFESIPETALHRPVDLAVVGADKEGQSFFGSIFKGDSLLTRSFPRMRYRLCSHIHHFTSHYLGNCNGEAL